MDTTIRINTDLEKAVILPDKRYYDYKASANGAADYCALASEIVRKCIEGRK